MSQILQAKQVNCLGWHAEIFGIVQQMSGKPFIKLW